MMRTHKTVIDMTKMNEESMTPEEFLRLSNEQRRDIAKATPFVKSLGSVSIDNSDFVSLIVKWKTPRYRVNL